MTNPETDSERDERATNRALSRLFAQAQRLEVVPRRSAHWLIRSYQLSFSMLVGRQCRHWPSCSAYTDEAIQRHGLWRGGWVGIARICRCNPWGTSGIDLVCEELPASAAWYRPWRYGRWRGVDAPPPTGEEATSDSDAQPAAGDGDVKPHP